MGLETGAADERDLAAELHTEDSLSADEADLLADFVDAGELQVKTGVTDL
jgi:hypothetical protein